MSSNSSNNVMKEASPPHHLHHKTFSMPHIPSLSLQRLQQQQQSTIPSSSSLDYSSSTGGTSNNNNNNNYSSSSLSSSSSSNGIVTPRSLFESFKKKLSKGLLLTSPRATRGGGSASSPPTTSNGTTTSFMVVEDDPTLLNTSSIHPITADDYSPTSPTIHLTAKTTTTNNTSTSCSSPTTSSSTSTLCSSSRTNSFSSIYSLNNNNSTNNNNYSSSKSPTTITTPSSPRIITEQQQYLSSPSSTSSSRNNSIGGGGKLKTPPKKKRNSFLSLITNGRLNNSNNAQQKSPNGAATFDSLFDETISPKAVSSSSKKKKSSSNSYSNQDDEDLSIKTNNLSSTTRNRSKSTSNQLEILPKLSLFTIGSPNVNNGGSVAALTPNGGSSVLFDGSYYAGIGSTAESPKSATSPRVSFQRLTIGGDDDGNDSFIDTTDDEYRQLMDSENGREIFFNFIQKNAHSEQIEFLQETIRLYQDNASILLPNKCTSPSANIHNNNHENFAFSNSLPPAAADPNPLYSNSTQNSNQLLISSSTTATTTRYFSSCADSSYAGDMSALYTTTTTSFESSQSSVPISSSIGTLKKVISKNKLSKPGSVVPTLPPSSFSSPSSIASAVEEDRSLVSTSEILQRYKQQKMQNIQQAIMSSQQQQQQSSTSQTSSSHVFFGFNLYHIDNLVKKFILEHSPKELNLSKRQRQKVCDQFEKLKNDKLEFLNKEVYVEGSGVKEIPQSLYTDILVTEEEFVEIFRELINVINLQLKLECFREFRCSKEYLDVILCNMGDVVGVASVVGSMSQDKLEPLVSPRRNNRLLGGKQRRLSEADLIGKNERCGFYPFGEQRQFNNNNIKTPRTMMRNMKNPLELFQLFANIHR